MRRLIPTSLITLSVLLGALSLGGCVVDPHRGPEHSSHRDSMHQDSGDHHHDDRHDHDHDHDGEHGH